MYTWLYNALYIRCDIFDPGGVFICSVETMDEAQALLSHLNRR